MFSGLAVDSLRRISISYSGCGGSVMFDTPICAIDIAPPIGILFGIPDIICAIDIAPPIDILLLLFGIVVLPVAAAAVAVPPLPSYKFLSIIFLLMYCIQC
ncbi:hypothetical protein SAMD00019534_060140 [Acytostelium subglobosum LB1]|uniref:hypothetical protein n=1 Tax=Acytostelium subglobosum LB1 TaxID=1410327 RepID=UPI000644CB41|nr:hypothetical protein SAMD00019534_060140 [Acytostelium subglobosum LB1]GAM22839.1 hypothetical protein SAMD00019534_060140 [Acytostelium subglobosum LB1]|eukprot:XP_012754066.1 hypothetical protein SAMD00019534_060140 [Acytostelium subglobosum LB1]